MPHAVYACSYDMNMYCMSHYRKWCQVLYHDSYHTNTERAGTNMSGFNKKTSALLRWSSQWTASDESRLLRLPLVSVPTWVDQNPIKSDDGSIGLWPCWDGDVRDSRYSYNCKIRSSTYKCYFRCRVHIYPRRQNGRNVIWLSGFPIPHKHSKLLWLERFL